MTRDEKILALRGACGINNPSAPLQLRDVLIAIRHAKLRYIIGDKGFFMEAERGFRSYKPTNIQWSAFQNDVTAQSDQCINFLFEMLCNQTTS